MNTGLIDTENSLFREQITSEFDTPLREAVTTYKINPFGYRLSYDKKTITDILRNGQYDRHTELITESPSNNKITITEALDKQYFDCEQLFYDTSEAKFFTLIDALQVYKLLI